MSLRFANVLGGDKRFYSQSFDSSEHTWAKFYNMSEEDFANRTKSGDGDKDASPEKIFEEVEATLALDDKRLLREAIAKETGVLDANVTEMKVTLVNRGVMQAILKIDVKFCTFAVKKQSISLIGIVTLHDGKKAQEYSQKDYNVIAKLRQKEASSIGLIENDPTYGRQFATFPPRDGEAITPNGHHLQLTRLLEGFYEVNLKTRNIGGRGMVNKVDRSLVINRWTQGALSEVLNGKESESLSRDIINHQLTTAIKCNVVLAPSFSAGDYLYNPEEKRLVLHTAPEREHDEECDLWRKINKQYLFPQGSVDPKIYYAAFQILHMLTTHDGNLYTLSNDENAPQPSVYTYGIETIVGALEDMSKNPDLLSRAEWREVAKLLPRWVDFVFKNIGKTAGADGKTQLSVVEDKLLLQKRILADRLKECATRIFAMTMSRGR